MLSGCLLESFCRSYGKSEVVANKSKTRRITTKMQNNPPRSFGHQQTHERMSSISIVFHKGACLHAHRHQAMFPLRFPANLKESESIQIDSEDFYVLCVPIYIHTHPYIHVHTHIYIHVYIHHIYCGKNI